MIEINRLKEEKFKILIEEIKTLKEKEIIKVKELKEIINVKELKEKKRELMIIQRSIFDRNYEIKHSNNEKKIIIINILSGDKIILKNTIKMTSTLSSLYHTICNEIKKVNISNMIINKYVYTRKNYNESLILHMFSY